MARARSNKLYRNFVKGLITEASALTFPENSCFAMDNCQIYRKGNQSRRLGFDYEDLAIQSTYGVPFADVPTLRTQGYRWDSVNGDASVNFVVHRVGTTLYFYDADISPVSSALKPFSINLNSHIAPNASGLGASYIAMVGGKGVLFVTGEKIEPFFVTYNADADSVSTTRLFIQIRDFKGIDSGLANDQEPATLSAAHKYNLMNQGWVDPTNNNSGPTVSRFDAYGNLGTGPGPTTQVITDYFTQFSRYPGGNKQWWVARDSTTNDFDAELLSKFFTGNNRVARGHFIVDAFNIDRTAMSGVAGIAPEVTEERPPTVSFFAGRVWFACNSTVYFSQVLDDPRKGGFCYQEADPTSEDISDLIDSDGGVIPIPEMAKAFRLVPAGSGMVVFSSNGIWYITGGQGGFSATDYSVHKINPIGTDGPDSIVEAEGQIFWWSKVGIQGMSQKLGMFGAIEGAFDRTNITEQTIQSFYNSIIPEVSKRHAKGVYDPATNTVVWIYSSGQTPGTHMYDRVLNLDLTLGAFYPYSLSASGPYITDLFLTNTINPLPNNSEVRESFIKYIVASPEDLRYTYTFGYFKDNKFRDWFSYDQEGHKYLSFIETGYELMEDAMRDKQSPYVWTYFRRTEQNFVPDGSDYTVDFPSSCYLQIKWDWSNSNRSNKWSSKIQAYRLTRLPMFEDSDLAFDTGFPVVVTKNKVRGSGKSIQFRFESDEIGKDFDLLGWAVPVSGNTEP